MWILWPCCSSKVWNGKVKERIQNFGWDNKGSILESIDEEVIKEKIKVKRGMINDEADTTNNIILIISPYKPDKFLLIFNSLSSNHFLHCFYCIVSLFFFLNWKFYNSCLKIWLVTKNCGYKTSNVTRFNKHICILMKHI